MATTVQSRGRRLTGKAVLRYFKPSRHRGLVSLIVFLIIWEVAARYFVNDKLFLTGPWDVTKAVWKWWHHGDLQHDLWVSTVEFLQGFIPSTIFGILLGLLVGASDAVKAYADPVMDAMYATPIVALAPLFILWFGIGTKKTVVLVIVLVFLPVTINTDAGIRAIDPQLIEAGKAFGAGRLKLFRKVHVPGALPFIITGIRLAIGRGLIAIVVGELFGSQAGVGYRINLDTQNFQTSELLGGVAIFAVAGVVLVKLMQLLERKIAPWRAADVRRGGSVVTQ